MPCCCSRTRVPSLVQSRPDLTPGFLVKDVISRAVIFPCFPNTFQTSTSESLDSRVSRSWAEHDTRPGKGSEAQEINNERSRTQNIWRKVGACSTVWVSEG